MIEQPKKYVPAFLVSCREPDASELGIPAFDPNITTLTPPPIFRTADGHYDEENAAKYLSYKMHSVVKLRTRRDWRKLGKAPASQSGPGGHHRWYRQANLDEFIYITMRDDETDI